MKPCLFGLLAAALTFAFGTAGFAAGLHFLEERGEGGVSFESGRMSELAGFFLGGSGGLMGGFDVGVLHGLVQCFTEALLFVG